MICNYVGKFPHMASEKQDKASKVHHSVLHFSMHAAVKKLEKFLRYSADILPAPSS